MIQCSLVTAITGSYLSYFYAVEIVLFNLLVINILFQHILAVLLQHQIYKCFEMPENPNKNSVVFYYCIVLPFLVQNYSIMKGLSQKYKMVEVVITSRGCLVQPSCSSWGHPELFALDHTPVALNISKERLHSIPGQLVPVLSHHHGEKVFPDF